MKVKGIRWIGVGTPDVARMRSFAVDVLGMRVVGQDTESSSSWPWVTGRSWSSSAVPRRRTALDV